MNTGQPTAVYEREVSEIYDFFYSGRGKDFAAEAAEIAKTALAHKPDATSLLDVACGTGEHLRWLATHFLDVAGVEMSPSMCAVASAKREATPIHRADMRDFRLDRTFDVVTCLTSSLGYMASTGELDAAVGSMAAHLAPGGVLVIDPYWTPESFLDGYIASDTVRGDDQVVMRLSHSVRTGVHVRHEAHYVHAQADGVRHFVHVQPLTLFSREEYLDAVRRAGLQAGHVDGTGGFADRGLFVGVRRA
jgi:SAM-dependent methyltransferase